MSVCLPYSYVSSLLLNSLSYLFAILIVWDYLFDHWISGTPVRLRNEEQSSKRESYVTLFDDMDNIFVLVRDSVLTERVG